MNDDNNALSNTFFSSSAAPIMSLFTISKHCSFTMGIYTEACKQ